MRNIPCSTVKKLFRIFSEIKESKDINLDEEIYIHQYHSDLIQNLKIKKLEKNLSTFTKADFPNVAQEGHSYLKGLMRFYEDVTELSKCITWKYEFCKILALDSIVISQYFDGTCCWSSDRCASTAQEVFCQSLKFFQCNNINEYFFGKEDTTESFFTKIFPHGVLKILLEEFLTLYNKDTYQEYPSYKVTYRWMMYNVKSPNLTDYIAFFLPPALFISDDWQIENKVYGICALQYIMENMPNSELRWHGRANVIFDALKKILHMREPRSLEYCYPAAIMAASILEKCPKESRSVMKKFYDILMDPLLTSMAVEQMLVLRTIYANALKLLIKEMKIFAVKWCDLILLVSRNYLETYEGEEAQDRLLILEALELLIKSCWPRIKLRVETFLKILLQLAYEINDEHTPVKNKDVILLKIKDICNLISACDPTTTRELCKEIEKLNINFKTEILFVLSDIIK